MTLIYTEIRPQEEQCQTEADQEVSLAEAAVEMFDLFKKAITEICEDKKSSTSVKSYFVKSEESDIPEGPVVENA